MVSGPLKEMRLGSNDSMRKTLALTLTLSSWRERPELLSRLAPLNPPASGARDVPARSGSECNRRLGEGSGTSRLSEPLRPGTGRAPKEGSWAGIGSWVGRIAEDCHRRLPSLSLRPGGFAQNFL